MLENLASLESWRGAAGDAAGVQLEEQLMQQVRAGLAKLFVDQEDEKWWSNEL
jgi:hypothetical protein